MRQGEIIQIGRPTEILRDPVDDYVAQFVEDISLVRAVQAADIAAESGLDCGPQVETVQGTMYVEELVAKIANGTTGFHVVNDERKSLGVVDRRAVLKILEARQGAASLSELTETALRRPHWDPGLAIWMSAMAFTIICLVLRDGLPWLASYSFRLGRANCAMGGCL